MPSPSVSCPLGREHPQTCGTPPPPHVNSPRHVPQDGARCWPQLSVNVGVPQLASLALHKALSGSGVQPHIPDVPPPPQLCGGVHVPQLTLLPQLSTAMPQLFPAQAVPSGVQPHTPGIPAPPHDSGGAHPQPTVLPQLSVAVPQ
jgi:hypothetical protein